MALEGGDCIRKEEARIYLERFMQVGKPVKFQGACCMI